MSPYTDYHKEKKSNKSIFITVVLTVAIIFVSYQLFLRGPELVHVQRAVVVLKGNSAVSGKVTFEQPVKDGPVTVSGTIENLDPSSFRGFHVQWVVDPSGDLSNDCLSTAAHFNPFKETHGAPTDSTRHVGDLGNIASDKYGVATFSFTDNVISLNGPKSIIGRAVVVHEGEDDLGRGGDEGSVKTGNAGGRAACGVIGRG